MEKCFWFFAISLFLLSCADTERSNPYDERSPNYIGKSSGGALSSSLSPTPSSSSSAPPGSSSSILPTPSSSSSVPPGSSSSDISPTPSSSSSAPPSSSSPSSSSINSSSSFSSSSFVVIVSDCSADFETVTIGTQVWAKKNLDCDVEGSKCYGDDPENCNTYGRLYDWVTAMALSQDCNSKSCSSQIQSPHKGICPEGWHIPSNADWDKLYRFADGTSGTESPYSSPTAGKHLKAAEGWEPYDGIENLDTHGFSALPGGWGSSGGGFGNVGVIGDWWSSASNRAYFQTMHYRSEGTASSQDYGSSSGDSNFYPGLYSVRCLQD